MKLYLLRIKKLYKIIAAFIVLSAIAFIIFSAINNDFFEQRNGPLQAKDYVNITVTPPFNFRFDIMQTGVLQHVDRSYTYDFVPEKLINGILFQGIHRLPLGTSITIETLRYETVYFFFHQKQDGGYSTFFEESKKWKRCEEAPKYDIANGDHGLNMQMYRLKAKQGIYTIPSSSEKDACFSIVFQKNKYLFF